MSNISDHADDAVTVAPHLHEVIFENDKKRVLKVTVKPGDKAEIHWHPEEVQTVQVELKNA